MSKGESFTLNGQEVLMLTLQLPNSGVSGKKIAILGGGLAGLFCAITLARKGAIVTVLENVPYPKHRNRCAVGGEGHPKLPAGKAAVM